MKLKSIINSNNAMKKNGYQIVRKLHKLEKKKNLSYAYAAMYQDVPFWLLSFQNMNRIMKTEYGNATEDYIKEFLEKSDAFQQYLEGVAARKGKINKSVLAAYLRAYTKFFNRVKKAKKFDDSIKILEDWNKKCVMAYYAVWRK